MADNTSSADHKKITMLKTKLEKAIEDKNEETTKLILNQMRQAKVTEELLRTTKAGLLLGRLRRKSTNMELQTIATEIIDKWKKEMKNNNKRKRIEVEQKKEENYINQDLSNKKIILDASPSSVEAEKEKLIPCEPTTAIGLSKSLSQSSETKTQERTFERDKVTIKTTENKTRDKCIELLYNSLCSSNNAEIAAVLSKAIEIENEVFEKYELTINQAYKGKISMLRSNIKINSKLQSDILCGAINTKDLTEMSAKDLASEELKLEMKKIEEENIFKARGAGEIWSETDMFRCGKCKNRRTTYTQMQTRSADEPMTTFVTCLVCSNRWKC